MFKIFNENEKDFTKPRKRDANHAKKIWHYKYRQKKTFYPHIKMSECGVQKCPFKKNIKKSKKLIPKSFVINRAFLTPQQHLQLLAEPKKESSLSSHKVPHCKLSKISMVRIEQLAAPKLQNVIGTWEEHQETLPVQKVYNLNCFINTNNYEMNIREADSLFKKFDKEKAEKRKKIQNEHKKLEFQKLSKQRNKLSNKIMEFSKIMIGYLYEMNATHLNHYEKQIADKIIKTLKEKKKLIHFNYNTPFIAKILRDISYNCAIFASGVLARVENVVTSQERTKSSSLSIKSSEARYKSFHHRIANRSSKAHWMVPQTNSPSINLKNAIVNLLTILQHNYMSRIINLDSSEEVNNLDLSTTLLYNTIYVIQDILASNLADKNIQDVYEMNLKNWIIEINPSALDDNMNDVVVLLSQILALNKEKIATRSVLDEKETVQLRYKFCALYNCDNFLCITHQLYRKFTVLFAPVTDLLPHWSVINTLQLS